MEEELKDIAVVGGSDLCLGFRLAGVDKTYETTDEGFRDTLREVMDKDLGIVVVHRDRLDQFNRKEREEMQNSVDPVLVAISGEEQSQDLSKKVKRVLGVDIWD